MFRLHLALFLALTTVAVAAADEPAYRTDSGDEKLPWFQLVAGEFPPAGSAHAISGELIAVDHVNRTGVLRQDRTGSQRTDEYDRPLPFEMLPYGSLSYHGAPAELRDIPIGTHLHGQFYETEKNGKKVFSRVLRLEDDFSHSLASGRPWQVESVDLSKRQLIVKGIGPADDQTDAKSTTFQLVPATRIWKGKSIAALADIAAGQRVLLNLTVCTLKGPGRGTDVWIDAEARDAAIAQQLEIHRLFIREHGIAARIDEVDNGQRIVTATLFGGFDPALKSEFRLSEHVAAAVAEENLRTHDQINDSSRGPVVELLPGPGGPGDSGLKLRFQPSELLEGHRPKRILRIFGNGWHVDDLPREEQAYDG